MTPHDIEQMKADREAGGDSEWSLSDDQGYITYSPYVTIECDDVSISYVLLRDRARHKDIPNWRTNARRIARVPTLEAEILRLREALTKIAGRKTYADDPWSIARRALNGDAP